MFPRADICAKINRTTHVMEIALLLIESGLKKFLSQLGESRHLQLHFPSEHQIEHL